ncbi:carbon-nitrogen hydrolase family protein [Geminicoccus roseus]|uniref:carbon-nitrogen hydrolase family protein n=1 Tax=Geminicoccus roseus TaxID=404900 RepID=UPI0003FC2544|nr:carbon-nitrogen hydrolase family protein [Geminicoccus roseus]
MHDPAATALAVLPEQWSGGDAQAEAELSDGPWARDVARVAVQKHCAIIAPYLEREGEKQFSSVLFVNRRGRGLCSYRKTHLSLADEAQGLARGNWMTIVPFMDQRIGLLLGEDILHPETSRCLALEGATLLVASSTLEPSLLAALTRVRAVENGVTFLAVSGGAAGRMVACDPEGRVLADAPTPATIDLHPVPSERPNPFAARRRAELYRAIVEPPPRG